MTDTPVMEEWDGAIGPQSDEEPIFYELDIDDRTVRLTGPSPGQLHEYDIDEFESLVIQGEWILAENTDMGYRTPDGETSY